MPGTAAIRSTTRISVGPQPRRRPVGDEQRGAAPTSGTAMTSAISATWMVPTTTAEMPMMSWLGSQRNSVKNDRP